MSTKSWFLIIFGANLVIGCAYQPPQKSLEKIAKDWSLTVRAGQVIPVYPLEEDLRPGDVFLVGSTVEQEVKSFNDSGFLPLVNRYARLPIDPAIYQMYYADGSNAQDAPRFARPPKAAFPSYTFTVDSRGAVGLAIPLSSVPLALSAVGARNATGSVVFDKASTQGLPEQVMHNILAAWAQGNRWQLAERSKPMFDAGQPLLLRLITRVYMIESATVTLNYGSISGASIQAGAPPSTPDLRSTSKEDFSTLITGLNEEIRLLTTEPSEGSVSLPEAPGEPSTDARIAALEAARDALERQRAAETLRARQREIERLATQDQFGGYLLPGAAVRVAGRSARGVTLKEQFEKPLVLGYRATEYLVSPTGRLHPLGNLRDLIENPKAYKELVEATKTLAKKLETKEPQYDS